MRATDQGTGNEGPWAETEIASARRASQRRGCWGWVLRSKSEPDEQGGRGIQAGRGGGAEAGAGTCPVCAWLMSVLLHSWGLNHDLRIPQSQGRVSGGGGRVQSIVCCRGSLWGRVEGRLEGTDLQAERSSVHRATRGAQAEDQGGAGGQNEPQVSSGEAAGSVGLTWKCLSCRIRLLQNSQLS